MKNSIVQLKYFILYVCHINVMMAVCASFCLHIHTTVHHVSRSTFLNLHAIKSLITSSEFVTVTYSL